MDLTLAIAVLVRKIFVATILSSANLLLILFLQHFSMSELVWWVLPSHIVNPY